MSKSPSFLASARRTIEIEERAVKLLRERLGGEFEKACQLILDSRGRVVVTGMGKSGHIGNKIAATLSSTGTPAMTMHPAEASHGDIGMITPEDIVLAISNSGDTEEIVSLLPALKRKGIRLISLTGNTHSALAQAADAVLDSSVEEEACPLGLAPTSSTTVTLVMGDALAMALLEARGFTRDDFAASHPGGRLGRRLLIRVEDIMHGGDAIPRVAESTILTEAILEMSKKGFGMTTVQDERGRMRGVFTDGDLRRAIDAGVDLQGTAIGKLMSADYKHIDAHALAAEAVRVMQESKVYVLVVDDDEDNVVGILRMHDLLQANVV